MGACRRALAVVAVALFAALPAQAAMMQAVYTGTIAVGGIDEGGLYFGLPDLSGQRFTATFVYDTSRGTRSTFPGSDSVTGGSPAGGVPVPVLSALLTINGRTYGFAPATIGAATVAVVPPSTITDPGSTITEHRGEANSNLGSVTVADVLVVALRAPGVIVPNLDLALALTDNDSFFQGEFLFARSEGGSQTANAGGRFFTDSVTITPVPLPAAAWLLLSGLGGLGFLSRGRKAA